MDANLIKRFGAGAFIRGDELQQYEHEVIHVSPKLDLVLGGGIPGGSVVTLAGPPKGGKTLSALHVAAKAQALGRKVFYINVEGRIKNRDLSGIRGLNLADLTIVRSYRNPDGTSRILNAEEFLEVVEHIAHNIPGAVIIIDSVSQLASAGELSKDLGERSYAPGAVLLAQLTKRLCNVIPVNDVVLIAILHVVASFARMGKQTSVTGGNKIKYACDIGLEIKKFAFLREGAVKKTEGEEDDGTGKIYGQKVTWITTCTAFAPPGMTTDSIIRYGVGIDEKTELIQLATEFGFITKSSSWLKLTYLLDAMPDKYKEITSPAKKEGGKPTVESNIPSLQGDVKVAEWFNENADEYAALEQCMRSMMQ